MTFEPIWGSVIAWYLFLAGLGGGAFVSAAIIRFKSPDARHMIRAGRVIAPIVVIIGLVLLMFDATAGFHNPLRFIFLLTNFGSVMTWGVVFLGSFVVAALIVAVMDLTNHADKVPKWLDVLGSVLGVCVAVYTGCLLGVCKTFPLWNNALLPMLFLVSAMSTGMASVLFVAAIRYPEEFDKVGYFKRFHFWFPVVELALVASLMFVTSFNASPAGAESVANMLTGSSAPMFWILFILIGLVIPIILEGKELFFTNAQGEATKQGHLVSAASDAGLLIGGFVLRLMILVAAMPITMVQPWM